MNKTLSFLALLLVVTGTTFAATPDEPASRISVLNKGETFKLLYKGDEQSDVQVFILNEDNQIVFREKIRATDGFVRPYNFSKLPHGNYSFELVDNNGRRQTEQVSYQLRREQKIMHVARLGGTADKFIVSVPNDGATKLSITIYDDSNRVLYSANESVSGDFAQVYNIQGNDGNVTFEIVDGKGKRNAVTKNSW
jgi:flagellar hook assembly protein FlgD